MPHEDASTQIEQNLSESARLLDEMDRMMKRAKLLVLDQQKLIAAVRIQDGFTEKPKDQ